MSLPQGRPATPGSTDFRSARQTPRSKGHAVARSGHSYTGSLHYSDAGSDYGSRSSPPPVPKLSSRTAARFESMDEYPEDRVEPDPRTPAEYALHAVFIRFASAAEAKIDAFLRENLVCIHSFSVCMHMS